MSTASERVRRLVDEGRVSPEEGVALLDAVQPPATTSSVIAMLINPFDRLGGGKAAAIGFVCAIAGVMSSRVGIRYDGYLDLHLASKIPSEKVALADQVSAWLLPSLVFWAISWIVMRRGRLIDMLGAVGLARAPYALLAFPLRFIAGDPSAVAPTGPKVLTVRLALGALLAIGTLTWMGLWQFFGFRNATGATGKKLGFGFLAALIACEFLSKIALMAMGVE